MKINIMSKLKYFLIFLAVIGFIYGYYNHRISQKQPTIQEQVTNDIDSTQKEINNLKDTVNKYRLKEQEEELRKIRLQQLQNPEIITNELSNISHLIVYRGQLTYNDFIKEGNWFANKSMTLNLVFNFGIAIDLKTILVSRFIEDIPVIKIPKNELKLEYVELDAKSSKINGEKTLLSNQFTPEDVKGIIGNAKDSVTNKITNDKSVYYNALINLKSDIRDLVLKLNYRDVIFEEE